jgi:sRNA-binding protein
MSKNAGITIELLARRFPLAFFVNGERRRPLKIGIIRDLVDADIGIPGTQIRQALAAYTNSPGYLRACREGEDRIALDGRPTGNVTTEEAQHSRSKLARIATAKGIMFPASTSMSTSTMSTSTTTQRPKGSSALAEGQPRRLSLGDLKEAWLRRQAEGAA